MTGLLGGGHAIYLDAATGTVRNLDCFVAVPSGDGAPMESTCRSRSARSSSHYAVGAVLLRRARACRPGSTRSGARMDDSPGRASSSRRSRSRGTGVAMPAAHAPCLAMLAPVMTMREGARIYAPGGALLADG